MGVVENIDPNDPTFVKGISGEYVHVLQKPGKVMPVVDDVVIGRKEPRIDNLTS